MTQADFIPVSQWPSLIHQNASSNGQYLSKIAWEESELTQGMYHAFIQISDDITLSVEAGGNPTHPPLLLIMGLGSQMLFWPETFIKRLVSAGFFVIRFDNRDIGLSSKIINKQIPLLSSRNRLQMMLKLQLGIKNRHAVVYTLEDMADDVAALLNQLKQAFGFEKFHVMGASMGGMIAQILAAKYPNYIDKLLLLFTSTNAKLLPPPKPKQLHALFVKPDNSSLALSVAHGMWFMQTIGSTGFINKAQIKQTITKRHLRNVHPLGIVQQLHAILATGDISNYSQQVQAKTLILHGDKDGLLPWQHGHNVAKHIPNARFQRIKGMGHDLAEYFIPYISHFTIEHLRS